MLKKPDDKLRDIKNLKDLLNQSSNIFKNNIAFTYVHNGECNYVTYENFEKDIQAIGTGLIKYKLKNKNIAILSENRYEWAVSYLAIITSSNIVIPLDRLIKEEELESLLIRSKVEVIFFSNKYKDKILSIANLNKTILKYLISFDDDLNTNNVMSYSFLLNIGKLMLNTGYTKYLDLDINENETSVILFTSATTEESKAVMISQKSICSNIMNISKVLKIYPYDKFLSILPLHHTYESVLGFLLVMYNGAQVIYAGGYKNLYSDIKKFHPSIIFGVPVIYEKMYKNILLKIQLNNEEKKVDRYININKFIKKYFNFDFSKIFFRKIHNELGGNIRMLISGAATLNEIFVMGFKNFGINLFQAYGLTEASPVVSIESEKYNKIGSSGKALPGIDIKIKNKDKTGIGEIVVKTPSCMLGYYNDEKLTSQIIKNGWLYTGDLGYLEDDYLFITGRKKNVIVLKNGENVFPEELEKKINEIKYVKESIVYPENNNNNGIDICAKIVYDKRIFEKETNKVPEENVIFEYLKQDIENINFRAPII